MKFERVGVFAYSREKNTYAYDLKPQINSKIKNKRKNCLMKLQKSISKLINENYINKTIPCIIEELRDDGTVVARSFRDAPEIDGLVYIKTKEYLTPGDIVNVKINSCNFYDLQGII